MSALMDDAAQLAATWGGIEHRLAWDERTGTRCAKALIVINELVAEMKRDAEGMEAVHDPNSTWAMHLVERFEEALRG